MMWEQVFVNRLLSSDETALGLSNMFGVERHLVLVLPPGIMIPEEADVSVVCETKLVRGGYPLMLTIYYFGEKGDGLAHEDRIKRLCVYNQVSCLMPDESPNPYSMMLILGDGSVKRVLLDAQKLDQENEYWVREGTDS